MATSVRTTTMLALELAGQAPVPLRSLQPASIQVVPVAVPGGQPAQLLRGGSGITLGEMAAEWDPAEPGPLLDWLQANLRGNARPISGAGLVMDANRKLRRRIGFADASLTALQFPLLDAADGKRPFTVGLRFLPSTVTDTAGGGKAQPAAPTKRKPMLAANFTLRGLPFAAEQVSQVALPLVQVRWLGRDGPRRAAPSLDLGEVRLVAKGRSAEAARAWVQTVIADGKLDGPELLDFSVELLDATLKNVLATLVLKGCMLLAADEPLLGGAAVEALDSLQLRFAVNGLDFEVR